MRKILSELYHTAKLFSCCCALKQKHLTKFNVYFSLRLHRFLIVFWTQNLIVLETIFVKLKITLKMSTYSIHHMQERAKESKVRRKSREQRSSWYFAILCLWMWMKNKWQERRYENGKCLWKWIFRRVESERDVDGWEKFPVSASKLFNSVMVDNPISNRSRVFYLEFLNKMLIFFHFQKKKKCHN